MAREVIVTGKTVNDAIDEGCSQLGVEREDIQFEIIDLPKKGFLGLKTIPAKVRIYLEEPEQPVAVEKTKTEVHTNEMSEKATEKTAEKNLDKFEKKITVAKEYLQSILREIGLENVDMKINQNKDEITIQLEGDGMGVIIGRRGETLDAIQYLVGLAANRVEGDYLRIIINSGNFREKREKTLEALAIRLAKNAVKTGRSNTLEPMNPYERRIIHAAVSQVEGAVSSSVGDEPNRCVVISSINAKRYNNYKGRSQYAKKSGYGNKRTGGKSSYSRSDKKENSSTERTHTSEQKTIRQTPPTEAFDQPLYSKIEIE